MITGLEGENVIKGREGGVNTMGCFDITKDLCDDISNMICKYWWSNQDKENKMLWINWEQVD